MLVDIRCLLLMRKKREEVYNDCKCDGRSGGSRGANLCIFKV